MRIVTLVGFVALVGACSRGNAIGPDDRHPDGQQNQDPSKDDPSDPSKPTPSDPSKAGTSGSRLKARYYEGEDGSKQFIGWWDSQRQEDCVMVPAKDGKLRCLPAANVAITGYADANCSVPVVTVRKGCAAPSAAIVMETSGNVSCSLGYAYAAYGVDPAKFTGTLYGGSPSTCKVTTGEPYAETMDFHRLSSEIPPTSFVAVNQTHD